MNHTIHPTLPSGFSYANEQQRQQYEVTGFVNGASKVCLIESDDPLPYPNLAVRLRPPRTLEEVRGRDWKKVTDVEQYRKDYNAGHAAGRRGSSTTWGNGGGSHAWDDGYLDASAERAKWHLTYCTDHDNCGEG